MAKWNWGGEENQGVGRIAASGDRAGGPADLSPQAVSTEGAHPLRDLAERCEKAAGPDEELDSDIYCALHPETESLGRPEFTASVDEAMTLVPEGWVWQVNAVGTATVFKNSLEMLPLVRGFSEATPALALCAAALRARDSRLKREAPRRETGSAPQGAKAAVPSGNRPEPFYFWLGIQAEGRE